ncbi:RluA family pseudouridine synthase [Canibacter sp. lx-45]|uniref:RluA family pseudouridine synthase n=1 Tax=Canibacter zhuwentaonis TaxID=2837491 RepID=UPI001BDCC4BF|nr:RluA family pseudouridine synthase [Canibacter zhuwentaonis]MBT1035265.1 RluA family pseudouridine synthase [Canibacter zhuwentaonis]
MPELNITVPAELDGVRADAAIAELTAQPRSWIVEIIVAGGATQDAKPLRKSDRLREGAHLLAHWMPKPEPEVIPEEIPEMRILHDDEHLVVVQKPAGVAAHPSHGWNGHTVLGGLAAKGYRIATSGAPERQGIVHRLDQGTSGVMVVCKSEYAYAELKRQFKYREVRKIYHALVQGHPDPFYGTIDAPIGRHPGAEWKFAVIGDGKNAVTHYDTLEALPHATLLEIAIETGRTHQIRVHMAAHKHPCVGDIMYGADPKMAVKLGLNRQWLHARELEITHPVSTERMLFQSDYTPELVAALNALSY